MAKKSLGQHFLRSRGVVKKIVEAGEVSNEDTVLEIGPGKGVLTKELLLRAKRVVAIEKDDNLIAILQEKFKTEIGEGKLKIIRGDVLEFDPEKHFDGKYKLIANIPYYITGEIFQKFLEAEYQPSTMVLLIQKEVASRIMARDHKESILSISIKIFGTPHYIEKVPARLFSPAPKVDSAILAIRNISNEFIKDIDKGHFFTLVKQGFSQKRKKLANNLSVLYEKNVLKNAFQDCSISLDSRSENLDQKDWKCLAKNLPIISTKS